jgi:hypothetical protein
MSKRDRNTDIVAIPRARQPLRRVRRVVARVGRGIGRSTSSLLRTRAVRGLVEDIVADGGIVPAGSRVVAVRIGAEAIVRVSVQPVGTSEAILFALALDSDSAGRTSLERSTTALRALSTLELPQALRDVLPIPPLESGDREGWTWVAQRELPGRSAERIAESGGGADRERLLDAGSATIELLHRATAQTVPIDASWLDRWVNVRAARLTQLSPQRRGDLEQIRDRIARALAGQELPVAWIHGDLWPRNVLVDDRGASVTGLVDWESATPDELPCQDAVHLVLMSRRLAQGGSLGARIIDALATRAWTAAEKRALARGGLDVRGERSNLPGSRLPIPAGVLLYWFRLVSENVTRRPALARESPWVEANLIAVARAATAETV